MSILPERFNSTSAPIGWRQLHDGCAETAEIGDFLLAQLTAERDAARGLAAALESQLAEAEAAYRLARRSAELDLAYWGKWPESIPCQQAHARISAWDYALSVLPTNAALLAADGA